MKILLISVFAEKSGWGKAANLLAEALNSNPKIDLVCRTVFLGTKELWNDTVKECHKKDTKNCDYCIQLLLPHLMEYSNNFKKCVGMFFNETNSYKFCSWSTILSLMDEVWVPYPSLAHVNSGVKSPVRVIEQPIDLKDVNFTPLPLPTEGDFVFYTIGELNKRKNLSLLVRAFYTEFGFHENVRLVIKANEPGIEPNETANSILDIVKKIKENLKITNRYIPEIIITNHLSEEDMISLHKACNCFVTPSHGEAICLPLLDAARVNNFIIAPNFAGTGHVLDLLDAKEFKINCGEEDVFGVTNTFGDLFTARETWASVDIVHLRKLMRNVYNLWNKGYKPNYDSELNEHFSYSTVSEKIIKALSDNTNINNS
jgi:glycosyltransferase involved in cell wall biosynthesis